MTAPPSRVTDIPARETMVIMEEIAVLDTEKSSLNIGINIPLVFSINGDRNIRVNIMITPNLLLLLFCILFYQLSFTARCSRISPNNIYIIISHWDII
jgi:hypothetical protein